MPSKIAFSRREKGFTVIEVLVGVAISAVIALVLTAILTQILQGGTKSDLISVVKQDGQSALGTLESSIRDSDGWICKNQVTTGNPNSSTIVIVTNGVYTRFREYDPKTTPANGRLLEDVIPASTISNYIEPDCQTGSCTTGHYSFNDLCTPGLTAGDGTPIGADTPGAVTITDTDPVSGVSLQSVPNSPTPIPVFNPLTNNLVKIEFNAFPGVSAGIGIVNEVGPSGIHFETTVAIRNQNGQ